MDTSKMNQLKERFLIQEEIDGKMISAHVTNMAMRWYNIILDMDPSISDSGSIPYMPSSPGRGWYCIDGKITEYGMSSLRKSIHRMWERYQKKMERNLMWEKDENFRNRLRDGEKWPFIIIEKEGVPIQGDFLYLSPSYYEISMHDDPSSMEGEYISEEGSFYNDGENSPSPLCLHMAKKTLGRIIKKYEEKVHRGDIIKILPYIKNIP